MRHPKYCFLHYAVNFVCRVRFKGGVVIIHHKGGVIIIHHKGGVKGERSSPYLDPPQNNFFLDTYLFINEKSIHVFLLVASQSNHLTEHIVTYNKTVALVCFFEMRQHLGLVEIIG